MVEGVDRAGAAGRGVRVRALERGDVAAVRSLFLATAACGRPLRLDPADEAAYVHLCLSWYLQHQPGPCAVLEEDGAVTGYAMVALDHAAYERWARPVALRWAAASSVRALRRPWGASAAFTGRRLRDGMSSVRSGPAAPMPAHFHFNVERSRRGVRAGFLLAAHADRVVAEAGLPGYFGEVNVPVDKPGRLRALERLGVRPVHQQRNHTLTGLAGEPVDRWTVVRSLDPAEGWAPLPHTRRD